MGRVPICVCCTAPVPVLVDRHGRLSHCANCNGVADKYVELETTIIMMDILLIKPEAYRHWIYNSETHLPWNAYRLAIITTLFHVYIFWAYNERDFILRRDHCSLLVSLALESKFPYIYFLSTSILHLVLFCFILSYFVLLWLSLSPPQNPIASDGLRSNPYIMDNLNKLFDDIRSRSPSPSPSRTRITSVSKSDISLSFQLPSLGVTDPRINQCFKYEGNANFKETLNIVSNTIVIASIINLFPIVMLIWPYDAPVLMATRLTVSLLYGFLLIEVLNIIIPDQNSMLSYKTIFSWMRRQNVFSPDLQRKKSKASFSSCDNLSSMGDNSWDATFGSKLRQRHHNSQLRLPQISPSPLLLASQDEDQIQPPQIHINVSPTKSDENNMEFKNKRLGGLVMNFKSQSTLTDLSKPRLNMQTSPAFPIPLHSYWKVVLVVLSAQLLEMIITHIIVIWIASAVWNVTVRDVLFDDWRMLKLAIKSIQELRNYAASLY